MNHIWRHLLRGLVALALIIGGVAWTRPGWLPPWARLNLEKLPAWARLGGPDTTSVDEDEDSETGDAPEDDDDDADPWRIIRLHSAEIASQLGVEAVPAALERHAHHLAANAETAYDAEHSAEVIPRVSGVLREVRVRLGQVVHRGAVLAVVDSAQVGTAKAKYLIARSALGLAQVTYDRTVALTREKAAPGKAEFEARSALTSAQAGLLDAAQTLRNFGFSDADLARFAEAKDTGNLLEIVAPTAGTVIAWDATLGEAVEPTTQLFALADTSRMWLWIDVYESEIASVAVGQPVTFTISGTDAPAFTGKVTWMGTEVNPQTRTTRIRAELPNPDGRLRANQFGRAQIQLGQEHEAMVIPRTAVQSDGAVEMVFVPMDDHSFRPQRVETRPTDRDEVVEVLRGLKPGERVVTTRSYMLKAELFRDRLGAADND